MRELREPEIREHGVTVSANKNVLVLDIEVNKVVAMEKLDSED